MGSSGIALEVAFFVEVFAPPSSSMLDSEVLSVAAASRKYLRRRDFVFLFPFLPRFPCSIAKVLRRRRRGPPRC
jgi:hypothetical protein